MRMMKLMTAVALLSFAGFSTAQEKVDSKGVTAKVKLEEVVSGYLTEVNGKYKLRATEVTFAPGAYLGAHHHLGPGIRYVVSGTLTFTEVGKDTLYKTGDMFFESGNVAHTARNNTDKPLRMVFFEIVPADLAGPSTILPRAY